MEDLEEQGNKIYEDYRASAPNPLLGIARMLYEATPLPEVSRYISDKNYGARSMLMNLQDKYVPFNSAYQNWLNDRPQDWERNVLDAAVMAYPMAKGAMAGARAAEKGMAKANAAYTKATGKNAKSGSITIPTVSKPLSVKEVINYAEKSGINVTPELEKEFRGAIGKSKQGKDVFKKLSPEGKQLFLAYDMTNNPYKFPDRFKTDPRRSVLTDKELLEEYMTGEGVTKDELERMFYDEIKRRKMSGLEDALINIEDAPSIETLYKKVYPSEYDEIMRMVTEDASPTSVKKSVQKNADTDLKAAKQAEKEARWKAEREAQNKALEERRLAKEAEAKRLAEDEAARLKAVQEEAARLKAEADAKAAQEAAFEEEYQRMLAEEEARKLADEEARMAAEREFEDIYAKELEKENADLVSSFDEFTDKSIGVMTPESQTSQNTGATRRSYSHERPFNGGTFKVLDPIDRQTLLKNRFNLGDRMFDAQSRFLLGYADPGAEISTTSVGRSFKNMPKNRHQDPYYQAGIINDRNVKLNKKIDELRMQGKTDAEIYEELRPELEKYQGMVDRYKYRLNNPESIHSYDEASTNNIVATPSEEITVLRMLGLDPADARSADIMDKYNTFYDDLIRRIKLNKSYRIK